MFPCDLLFFIFSFKSHFHRMSNIVLKNMYLILLIASFKYKQLIENLKKLINEKYI